MGGTSQISKLPFFPNEIDMFCFYTMRKELKTTLLNGFLVLGVAGTTVLTMLPFWPSILDIVSPANESRPHPQLHIRTEYFIDPEKYFFPILLHANAACCVGGLVMLAIGTMNITYIQLICGMFRIAR